MERSSYLNLCAQWTLYISAVPCNKVVCPPVSTISIFLLPWHNWYNFGFHLHLWKWTYSDLYFWSTIDHYVHNESILNWSSYVIFVYTIFIQNPGNITLWLSVWFVELRFYGRYHPFLHINKSWITLRFGRKIMRYVNIKSFVKTQRKLFCCKKVQLYWFRAKFTKNKYFFQAT